MYLIDIDLNKELKLYSLTYSQLSDIEDEIFDSVNIFWDIL